MFQKEGHGFDRWTSIYRSFHLSLYLSIFVRVCALWSWQIGRVDYFLLWKKFSTIYHGVGKPSILSVSAWFENGHYLALAWCETFDPGLGRVFSILDTFDGCFKFENEEPLHLLPHAFPENLFSFKFLQFFRWFSGLICPPEDLWFQLIVNKCLRS